LLGLGVFCILGIICIFGFAVLVCLAYSGPDYMANFSPANQAEISFRLLKQILLKSNCRLHGEGFSPGRNSAQAKNPSPVFQLDLKI